MKKNNGHTYTEILLTMMFIGVLFTLTIPTLNKNTSAQDNYKKLVKFNDLLQVSVNEWKSKNICPYKFGQCLKYQKLFVNKSPDFDIFMSKMNIFQNIPKNKRKNNKYLPAKTLNYFGTQISEFDFRSSDADYVLMLVDETVLSAKLDDNGIWVVVDVNGKRPPNRIGKDTFHFTIGYDMTSDIGYYPKINTSDKLCGLYDKYGMSMNCDISNLDPYKSNGACPTGYVLIHQKPIDFKELSEKVHNIKP